MITPKQEATMGPYGWYIWGSYGLCFVILGGFAWITARLLQTKKKILKNLESKKKSLECL